MTSPADGVFRRLCDAMGQPALVDDPRFVSHNVRWQNIEAINAIVARWIGATPVAEVTAALDAHGLAYSLVYSAADIVADPHYAARGSIATIEHPRVGPLKVQAPQPRLTGTPAPPLRPAPALGEDTHDVLSTLIGLSADEIERLRREGVV